MEAEAEAVEAALKSTASTSLVSTENNNRDHPHKTRLQGVYNYTYW